MHFATTNMCTLPTFLNGLDKCLIQIVLQLCGPCFLCFVFNKYLSHRISSATEHSKPNTERRTPNTTHKCPTKTRTLTPNSKYQTHQTFPSPPSLPLRLHAFTSLHASFVSLVPQALNRQAHFGIELISQRFLLNCCWRLRFVFWCPECMLHRQYISAWLHPIKLLSSLPSLSL